MVQGAAYKTSQCRLPLLLSLTAFASWLWRRTVFRFKVSAPLWAILGCFRGLFSDTPPRVCMESPPTTRDITPLSRSPLHPLSPQKRGGRSSRPPPSIPHGRTTPPHLPTAAPAAANAPSAKAGPARPPLPPPQGLPAFGGRRRHSSQAGAVCWEVVATAGDGEAGRRYPQKGRRQLRVLVERRRPLARRSRERGGHCPCSVPGVAKGVLGCVVCGWLDAAFPHGGLPAGAFRTNPLAGSSHLCSHLSRVVSPHNFLPRPPSSCLPIQTISLNPLLLLAVFIAHSLLLISVPNLPPLLCCPPSAFPRWPSPVLQGPLWPSAFLLQRAPLLADHTPRRVDFFHSECTC